jgi:general secretion pathway protein A
MYLAFYGLEQEPFRISPDPRFLHLAAPHRTTLEAMLEGVSSRKGLQVSVGPIGTGKTTLLYCLQHILMREASPTRPVRTAFIVNPLLTAMELFQAIFDELEVSCPTSGKPACLRALHEILCEGCTKNGTLLLIIDEAHLLSPELLEEIRLLLNLDNYPLNVLQVLLCGQPELLALLDRPQFAALQQRVSVLSRLRPLTLIESRAYIAERLQIAGLRGHSPFSTRALEEIYHRTNGVPRLINLLCDRVLAAGHRSQAKRIGPDYVVEAAGDLMPFEGPQGFSETPLAAHQVVVASSSGVKP